MEPSSPPKALRYVQYLTIPHIARVVGVLFVVEFTRGTLPASFAIPAGFGDVLTAVTAPLVVLALRRGALRSWGAALLWNGFGVTDFAVAMTEGLIAAPPLLLTLPWILIPTVAVPILVALHIAAFVLLTRRSVRNYFAGEELARRQATSDR